MKSSMNADQRNINTIRMLSIDAIQKANNGHPGLPMGAASMAYVLWTRFLKHNPQNPKWYDRDRFVLSAGHGSMLLFGLGEDGPTHQPVEQLASLRAIPRLIVIRPADANETAVAWQLAIETFHHPIALILTRQAVPTLNRTCYASASQLRRGAYILADPPKAKPILILIATGSEVQLIVKAQKKLEKQKIHVRIVSMPSWELFEAQSKKYRDRVLPSSIPLRIAIEAGVAQGWERYVGSYGEVISIEKFGASAAGELIMKKYGFSVENICKRVKNLLRRKK